jgi:hypothetical protein
MQMLLATVDVLLMHAVLLLLLLQSWHIAGTLLAELAHCVRHCVVTQK